MPLRALGFGGLLAWVVPVVSIAAVAAPPVVRPLEESPVAVAGGVVVFPVSWDPAEDAPRTVGARLDDGRVVEGVVGWTRADEPPAPRAWSASGERTTLSSEPPPTGDATGAWLLVPMPEGYRGRLRLGGGTVSPRWLDPAPTFVRPRQQVASSSAEARPDERQPLEWWRWAVLADRLGIEPPPPSGDEAGRLAARHLAELWRAAIARVERRSPGVAEEIRERLTVTVADLDSDEPRREVAAWLASPTRTRMLLGIMLDPERDDESAMQASLAWLRTEDELTMWIESALADRVSFAVANPRLDEAVLRCRWLEGDPIPVAVTIPPRSLRRVQVDRPVRSSGGTATEGVLVVTRGEHRRRLDFGASPVLVRPPGQSLGAFSTRTSLAEVQGVAFETAASRSAAAEVRRRDREWEVFLECFRPSDAREDVVEIRLGGPDSRVPLIRVRERGEVEASGASVERRSYPDRWRCRVVLPAPWLAESLVGLRSPAVGLSIDRRLEMADGSSEVSSIGPPLPPWRPNGATVALDLTAWEEGPAPGGATPSTDVAPVEPRGSGGES